MTATEIKRDIHQLVDSVQNEITLVDLHRAVALIVDQQDMLLNDSDSVLYKRLENLPRQVEQGDYATNDEMKQQVALWLAS